MRHARNVETEERAEFMTVWRAHAGRPVYGRRGAVSGPIAMLVQRVKRRVSS